jgi:hypothetical protein
MYCFTAEEIAEGLMVVLGEAPSAAVVKLFVAGCRMADGTACRRPPGGSMLRELSRKLLTEAAGRPLPVNSPPLGTVTERTEAKTIYYGEVEGVGPVTITDTGNVVGFSPARFCIDNDKEGAWIPEDRILFTDPRLQPVVVVQHGTRR